MIEMPTSAATNVLIMPMLGNSMAMRKRERYGRNSLSSTCRVNPVLGKISGEEATSSSVTWLRCAIGFFALTMKRSRSRLIVCIFRLGDFSGSVTIPKSSYLFFFNDTATTEIYTLSLHDALPIAITGEQHTGSRASLVALRRCLPTGRWRSEEHTSELQSRPHLVCRLLLEKKKPKRLGTNNPQSTVISTTSYH